MGNSLFYLAALLCIGFLARLVVKSVRTVEHFGVGLGSIIAIYK